MIIVQPCPTHCLFEPELYARPTTPATVAWQFLLAAPKCLRFHHPSWSLTCYSAGQSGQYAHNNQPTHHLPYLLLGRMGSTACGMDSGAVTRRMESSFGVFLCTRVTSTWDLALSRNATQMAKERGQSGPPMSAHLHREWRKALRNS